MAAEAQVPTLAFNLPVLAVGGSDLAKWGPDPMRYSLASYDLPQWAVVPLLLAFRHVNTLADIMYYDTGAPRAGAVDPWREGQHSERRADRCGAKQALPPCRR